jgi:enediyne biosynthesis protein E4
MSRKALAFGVIGSSMALAHSAVAQPVVLGGVSFVDRAALGQITFGNIRGSIGVIDYDNDGWYDLFFADSSGLPNRLFRNVASPTLSGGRTFTDVSSAAGLTADGDGRLRGAGGVVVFDYDNDGFSDIYTLGIGGNGSSGLLYRNNGNGTFSNNSVVAGVRITGLSPASASAVDFDHDGFVDLFIASTATPGRTLTLLRNNGNGTFSDRSDLLPPISFTGITYAHAWNDYDHDGWEDGLILFNAGRPFTLKNVADPAGGRRFIDATTESGFTFVGPAPMGIALGDVNNDGWLDVAITDARTGTYFENRGGTFTQVFPYSTFFGWGTIYSDVDNDGDLDNYQAGSAGTSNIDWLLRNDGGGVFTDARSALNTTSLPSQQCARIDFDNDGREDIVTVNVSRFISLYHNQSSVSNHWSKVHLVGAGGVSTDAVGARVRLFSGGTSQVREVTLGSSYSAGEDPRMNFGLGSKTVVDRVEVIWPRRGELAARTDVFTGPFAADQILTFTPQLPCVADFDSSGGTPDAGDIDAYFAAWLAGSETADADRSGGTPDASDVQVFFEQWLAGGC